MPILCELGFSLPFSNGRVQTIFSTLKHVKTDRRTRLQSSTLSDQSGIQAHGSSLQNFSPKQLSHQLAVDRLQDNQEVPPQGPRKEYRPRQGAYTTSWVYNTYYTVIFVLRPSQKI